MKEKGMKVVEMELSMNKTAAWCNYHLGQLQELLPCILLPKFLGKENLINVDYEGQQGRELSISFFQFLKKLKNS